MAHPGRDYRLDSLEADMASFRNEMKEALREFSHETAHALEKLTDTLCRVQREQAKQTTIKEMVTGVIAGMAIVSGLWFFVNIAVSSAATPLKNSIEANQADIGENKEEARSLERRVSKNESTLEARTKQIANFDQWFRKRHERANIFYERAQLGEWEPVVRRPSR